MAPRRAAFPPLPVTVCVSVLLHAMPVLLGLNGALPSYDSEVHMFFADHYQRTWLDPWEPRWYGGFWVFSYPPLVHQGMALPGMLIGLERAYALTVLAAAVALPVAIWRLTREVAGQDAANAAAALAVVVPGGWATLYLWGQLPNFVSLVLAIAAASYLVTWTRDGGPWALVAYTGLAGASVAAHHLTGLIGLPMLALAAAASAVWGDAGRPRRQRLARAALALVCGTIAALPTLVPFVWWMENGRVAQAAVPHASRTNLFLDADACFELLLGMWAVPLVGLPLAAWRTIRDRSLLPFMALAALWGALSLGPALTPLPRLMFGDFAAWLTYERFGLWSTTLLLVPVGAALAALGARGAMAALLAGSLASGLLLAGLNALRANPLGSEGAASLPEVAACLDRNGSNGERYMSLGLGLHRSIRLSRLTRAASVDGAYLTARRDPLLSRSGANLLDEAASGGYGAMAFVRAMLRAPEKHRLRWVVSGSDVADQTVEALGCTRQQIVRGTEAPRSGRTHRITIWEAPATRARAGVTEDLPGAPAALAWMWALGPLSLLVSGAVAAARLARRTP